MRTRDRETNDSARFHDETTAPSHTKAAELKSLLGLVRDARSKNTIPRPQLHCLHIKFFVRTTHAA